MSEDEKKKSESHTNNLNAEKKKLTPKYILKVFFLS
jgi:hypothetical protein